MSASSRQFRQLTVKVIQPGFWAVSINNPPINLIDDETIEELHVVLSQLEQAEDLKVVLFQSENPDFFIAHYDASRAAPTSDAGRPAGYQPWRDFVLRLGRASFVSIAKVRGRTRGGGNEFILACDLRFASRERAIFGQPEVGFGIIPGGGALEWLPRLVGRSRALEIVLSADDFDADSAETYGMINRAISEAKLDEYVDAFALRIASFDKRALHAAKTLINRTGFPQPEEFAASNRIFLESLGWPERQTRRLKVRELGLGQHGDFELNLGKALGQL